MVASMTRSAVGHVTAAGGRSAVALLIVAAVLSSPLPAAAPTPAGTCPSVPTAAPVRAETPWPQQRYDYPALRRITDGTGVTVAVIDSGVDPRAPQLAHAVAPGRDMLDPRGDGRQDCVGHGTAVASIIAATGEPGVGLWGLAPGVRILPVRVSERVEDAATAPGAGTVADLAAGIRAAVAATPRPCVINLSITTAADSPDLRSAVAAALAADIVVVAAVGNDQQRGDPVPYPASYQGVVGVGAVGPDGVRVASSQIGPYVDLTAPGSGVVGAVPGHGQETFAGTSFAAPFVSATAALVRAHWPGLRQADVVNRMLATADPGIGPRPSTQYGYGVVNPMRAMTEVVTGLPPTGPPAGPSRALGPPNPVAPSSRPSAVVMTSALTMVAAAIIVAVVAAAMPAGRRRRWVPAPSRPRPLVRDRRPDITDAHRRHP